MSFMPHPAPESGTNETPWGDARRAIDCFMALYGDLDYRESGKARELLEAYRINVACTSERHLQSVVDEMREVMEDSIFSFSNEWQDYCI
jgi:hypothetical protein